MMLRVTHGILLLLIGLACSPRGWGADATEVLPFLKGALRVDYTHSFLESFYNFEELRTGQAEVKRQQVDVVGRFGVLRDLELQVELPVVIRHETRLKGLGQISTAVPSGFPTPTPLPDTRLKARGLGDIALGLRYGLLNPRSNPHSRIAWTLESRFSLPTAGDGFPAAGKHGDAGYGALSYRLASSFSKAFNGTEPYLRIAFTDYLNSDGRNERRGSSWEVLVGNELEIPFPGVTGKRAVLDTGLLLQFIQKGRGDLLLQVNGAPHFQSTAERNVDTEAHSALGARAGLILVLHQRVRAGVRLEADFIPEHFEDLRHQIRADDSFRIIGSTFLEVLY